MKPVVVTGAKRSGTAYIAAWITNCGWWCAHERDFPGRRPKWHRIHPGTVEASYAATPFLDRERMHVVHQVRHPLKVVASLMRRRDFADPTAPAARWPLEACLPARRRDDGPLERTLRWWLEWNRMVEPHAEARWRIEDLTDADLAATLTGFGRPTTAMRAQQGRAVLPRRINENRVPPQTWTWDDLPAGRLLDEVKETAARYGYVS